MVQNIIQGGDGWLFVPGNGVTVTVNATYSPSGPRTIKLTFKSVEVGKLRISQAAETLLAPALLPRGSLQQQVLLWFKEVRCLVILVLLVVHYYDVDTNRTKPSVDQRFLCNNDREMHERAPRTIKLTFKSAEVARLRISETAETLLAPALLPCGSLQQQVLLWFEEVRI